MILKMLGEFHLMFFFFFCGGWRFHEHNHKGSACQESAMTKIMAAPRLGESQRPSRLVTNCRPLSTPAREDEPKMIC